MSIATHLALRSWLFAAFRSFVLSLPTSLICHRHVLSRCEHCNEGGSYLANAVRRDPALVLNGWVASGARRFDL